MKKKRLQPKKKKFHYDWKLSNTTFTKDKGKVFSTFSSGGGSTMGYKLAGFDVIGCNEIDKRMMDVYKLNHNPKYAYLEPIQTFKLRDDLPKELYELDILDGSPPCSLFSTAGDRQQFWGKSKKFKEGQAEQVLDELFFDFIDLAKKLQPKIVIAENVKGLIQGNAVKYLTKVHHDLDKAGYYSSHYLVDMSKMGIPQRRERVFVIGLRKDIANPFIEKEGLFGIKLKLDLSFNEKEIPVKEFIKGKPKTEKMNYTPNRYGDVVMNLNRASQTIASINRYWIDENTVVDDDSLSKIGSFPTDYKYIHKNRLYLIAMSVPPVAIAKISDRIYKQILSRIKK